MQNSDVCNIFFMEDRLKPKWDYSVYSGATLLGERAKQPVMNR